MNIYEGSLNTRNSKQVADADYESRSLDTICTNDSHLQHKWYHNWKYIVAGIIFGIALTKTEVISWYRIQEMFRFQSFHMYGVILTAIIVAAVSVWLIKRFNIKTIYGEKIVFHPKKFNKGQVIGGVLFGLGWAMTGACPGPLFAQIGTGSLIIAVVLISAVAGTWVYGYLRDKLSH
jgi:uncharacterized protein